MINLQDAYIRLDTGIVVTSDVKVVTNNRTVLDIRHMPGAVMAGPDLRAGSDRGGLWRSRSGKRVGGLHRLHVRGTRFTRHRSGGSAS
ncbi:hypothetical protein GGQ68_000829 [Sagittula marina]|uniref:Uncharacterized protein n=1 Tax=Sagittula marina TaxID=943940 RepID=A0A7W6GRE6_9RHOB|nr:hypothetical protein [Sagittula marina]MBB3984513.1 hypothetical protein [Sagittula marina]